MKPTTEDYALFCALLWHSLARNHELAQQALHRLFQNDSPILMEDWSYMVSYGNAILRDTGNPLGWVEP